VQCARPNKEIKIADTYQRKTAGDYHFVRKKKYSEVVVTSLEEE
jgi:hypothetical protein